ncbi:MAG: hypothetical protein WC274_07300, partial [Sulfurimonas sp.]
EKISYRYSLEDARKPIKRQISRLLLHDNSPTLLYFYELLQSAQEEFALRDSCKRLQSENQVEHKSEDTSKFKTFKDDLKAYSDEGLINFEERLSKDMRGVMPNDAQYDELLHTYNELHNELIRRNLVKIPF